MVTKEEAKKNIDSIINYLRKDENVPTSMLGSAFDVYRYLEGSNETSYEPSKQDVFIMDYIKKEGSATSKDVMKLLELSQARTNTILNNLVSAKLLSKTKDSRENCYVIANDAAVSDLLGRYKSI